MKRRLLLNAAGSDRTQGFSCTRILKSFVLMATLLFAIIASAEPTQGQWVQYVKGLTYPANVKEGDMLRVGQTLSTSPNGRIILTYSWPTQFPQYPCNAFWIMGGGLVAKVRDLKMQYKTQTRTASEHIYNCGTAATGTIPAAYSENAQGIHVVAFSGFPGKGPPPRGLDLSVLAPLTAAVSQGVARLPRTFAGKLVEVLGSRLSIETTEGGEKRSLSGEITKDAKIEGAKTLNELRDGDVYVEYTKQPNGDVNRVHRIMRVKDEAFYRFMGFVEQPSYAQNCDQAAAGSSCIRFDDGYVLMVEGSNPRLEQSELKYGLVIYQATSNEAHYQHIAGAPFVLKIRLTDN
jgi:hypothetical protein